MLWEQAPAAGAAYGRGLLLDDVGPRRGHIRCVPRLNVIRCEALVARRVACIPVRVCGFFGVDARGIALLLPDEGTAQEEDAGQEEKDQ
jgi:hypothetical protein